MISTQTELTQKLRGLQRELSAERTKKNQYYRQWTMLSDYMAHRKYLESTRKITDLMNQISQIVRKRNSCI